MQKNEEYGVMTWYTYLLWNDYKFGIFWFLLWNVNSVVCRLSPHSVSDLISVTLQKWFNHSWMLKAVSASNTFHIKLASLQKKENARKHFRWKQVNYFLLCLAQSLNVTMKMNPSQFSLSLGSLPGIYMWFVSILGFGSFCPSSFWWEDFQHNLLQGNWAFAMSVPSDPTSLALAIWTLSKVSDPREVQLYTSQWTSGLIW